MMHNVSKGEMAARIALGVVSGLLAYLVSSWPGWIRIASGIVAVAFIGTALAGY